MEFYVLLLSSYAREHSVSIPNGMEFYAPRRAKGVPLDISIPNGMEFYNVLPKQLSIVTSFNSQRDGILHWAY